jgi:hypothetical protein
MSAVSRQEDDAVGAFFVLRAAYCLLRQSQAMRSSIASHRIASGVN